MTGGNRPLMRSSYCQCQCSQGRAITSQPGDLITWTVIFSIFDVNIKWLQLGKFLVWPHENLQNSTFFKKYKRIPDSKLDSYIYLLRFFTTTKKRNNPHKEIHCFWPLLGLCCLRKFDLQPLLILRENLIFSKLKILCSGFKRSSQRYTMSLI